MWRVAFVRPALMLALLGCGSDRGPEATSVAPAKPDDKAPEQATAADASIPHPAAATDAGPTPPEVHTKEATRVRSPAKTEMRCTLRVSLKGLYVDGEPMSQAGAIALCKRRAGAMVVLEDDAPKEAWKKVETALRDAKIAIMMRGPLGHAECFDNPLAKGCP